MSKADVQGSSIFFSSQIVRVRGNENCLHTGSDVQFLSVFRRVNREKRFVEEVQLVWP